MLKKLTGAQNLDELRGFEGESARIYFSSMNSMIKQEQRTDFAMTSRQRRPPRDRINALLSFLYTLLTYDCRAALECVGLDPQVGFLHSLRPGRPALALDLAEEFRSLIADRVTLTLINRCQLRESDFETRPGGAVRLTDDARKSVISTYQKRKQEEIQHPLIDDKVSISMIIHLQARLLARTIRQDMDEYLPFIYR
jgi:CRISPR-associated protein Cas1